MKKLWVWVLMGLLLCQIGWAAGPTKVVGVTFPSLLSPFYKKIADDVQELGTAQGYKIIVLAPPKQTDYAEQVQIIEDFIQKKVDTIMVCATSEEATLPALQKANKAKIPIIYFEKTAKIKGLTVASYVGCDNIQGGFMVGQAVAGILKSGKGNVVMITGVPGHDLNNQRQQGFKEALKPFPGIKIIANQTANWERAQAMSVMENILMAHPGKDDIDVVFGLCDEMALGAYQAIKAAGREGRIKIIGYDANADAIEAVKAGVLYGTLGQNGAQFGPAAADVLPLIFANGEVPQFTLIPCTFVTRANADEYVQ